LQGYRPKELKFLLSSKYDTIKQKKCYDKTSSKSCNSTLKTIKKIKKLAQLKTVI
jgi:hypothetical protein